MKKILVVLLLLPVIWFLLPTQKVVSDDKAAIDEYIPALMEEMAIPGLVIAKVTADNTFIGAYGKANIATGQGVTEDTLFNIASVSKPIMGVALLQLVDEGKLELDRDINDYLPFTVDNPKVKGEVITLRHLATHSSGVADYYDITSYADNQDSGTSLEKHLKSLLTPEGSLYNNGQHYLESAPGTKRKYSNLGAGLAGYLVEAVTGMSLAQYSKEVLFKSLGMDNTSWLLHDLNLEQVAVPYEVESCIPYTFVCSDTESAEFNHVINKYFNPPLEHKNYHRYPHFGNPQYPDGGVRTSIKELSGFLASVMANEDAAGNQLLSNELYKEMLTLQLPEAVSDSQRFFWRDNSMGLTGHTGSDLGVFSALYFDPQNKVGFIIVMNRGMDGKAATAMKKIADKMMAI